MSQFEFTPQPLEVLRARYAAAIETLYDHFRVCAGKQSKPTDKPDVHVFDSEDGLRLIISRDRWIDGIDAVHVSASIRHGTELAQQVSRDGMGLKAFISLAVTRAVHVGVIGDLDLCVEYPASTLHMRFIECQSTVSRGANSATAKTGIRKAE